MNNSVLDRIKDTLESLAQGDVKMEGVWYGACRETKLFCFQPAEKIKSDKH